MSAALVPRRSAAPALAALRLAVPAYAHPLDAPDLWGRLTDAADVVRLVVVNPHDGPGATPDPSYPPVVAALQDAAVRLVGYVDTGYGRRPVGDVVSEVETWVGRDGLRGVFLDQVSSGLDHLEHYAQLVNQVRAAGAHFVALNPGVHPHPGYLDLANLVVTFEGAWEDYQALRVPAWTQRFPASRLCHLVHAVPDADLRAALALAAGRHVEAVMVSRGTGANPWDDVPIEVLEALQDSRAVSRRRVAVDPPSPPVEGPAVKPRGARAGAVLAAAAALADGCALAIAGSPALDLAHLLPVLLVGLLAGGLAGARLPDLTSRDRSRVGLAYHASGLAALALAPGPGPATAAGLLAGAGAALLVPALLRLAVPERAGAAPPETLP